MRHNKNVYCLGIVVSMRHSCIYIHALLSIRWSRTCACRTTTCERWLFCFHQQRCCNGAWRSCISRQYVSCHTSTHTHKNWFHNFKCVTRKIYKLFVLLYVCVILVSAFVHYLASNEDAQGGHEPPTSTDTDVEMVDVESVPENGMYHVTHSHKLVLTHV